MLNQRVKTMDICRRALKLMRETILVEEIDYLVLAGDMFDEVGFMSDNDVTVVQSWIHAVIKLCASRGVKLRVLEGTPSHDRGQSKAFMTINRFLAADAKADVLYIDKIDVVKESDGSTWLYVPDLSNQDCDVVLENVKERLFQEGLTKVDFVVTHTMYQHHIDQVIAKKLPSADDYLALCTHYALNGHIHTSSIYKDRFITNGSLDRLKHKEEEPKGMWLVEVSNTSPSENRVTFIENKLAEIMTTIDLDGLSLEAAINKVEFHCHPTEKRFLRLKINKELFVEGVFKHFATKYSHIVWSKKVIKPKTEEDDSVISFTDVDDITQISADTISDLLRAEMLIAKVDTAEIEAALLLLETV